MHRFNVDPEFREIPAELLDEMVVRVPPSWTLIARKFDGAVFHRGRVQVIISIAFYEGECWRHVSACVNRGPGRQEMPSWDQLKRVKVDFLGDAAWAYQVLPPAEHHVNINPAVLHLFALWANCPALPDFTCGTGSL